VQVWTHPGNPILGNSIYNNNGYGIQLEDGGNNSLAAPEITDADANSIHGTTCAGCLVNLFSDDEDQGRVFEGSTLADAAGSFEFSSTRMLHGPYVTCTATDQEGNTSEFSDPAALTFVRRGGGRLSP
jgi:parallel beta-helix repeat protein